jgi:hypothetical protein
MPRSHILTMTESAIIGLFFMQRYRFLTIDQFARPFRYPFKNYSLENPA